MFARNKLDAWIRRQVVRETEEDGPLRKLVLSHVANGKLGNEVHTVSVPKRDNRENLEDFISLAINEFDAASEQDANGIGGTQTYIIQSVFGDNEEKTRARARFTFRVFGDEEEDTGEVSSEPATKSGLLTQLMRHNEGLTKSLVAANAQIISTLQRTIARQAEQLEKSDEQRIEGFRIMEDLLSEKNKRDIEAAREAHALDMKQDALNSVKMLLPVAINKMVGKHVLPENLSAKEAQFKALAESMTPDQFAGILSNLSPAQQIALTELLGDFLTKKEEKQ